MDIQEFLAQVPRLEQLDSTFQYGSAVKLPSFSDRLHTIQPAYARAVIAVQTRQRWLRFITLARGYRTDFSLIHRMAVDLAPTVLNTGVVPIIEPIQERNLAERSTASPLISLALKRGALLWERRDASS